MTETDREREAHDNLERNFEQYQDVYAIRDSSDAADSLPVLKAWVIVMVHDDAADPSMGATYIAHKRFQSVHESVGLLQIALHDYLGGWSSDRSQ